MRPANHYHINVGRLENEEQIKPGKLIPASLENGRKNNPNNIEQKIVDDIVNKSSKKVRDILENRIQSIHKSLKLNEADGGSDYVAEGSDYQFIIAGLVAAGEAIVDAIGVGAAVDGVAALDVGVDAVAGLGGDAFASGGGMEPLFQDGLVPRVDPMVSGAWDPFLQHLQYTDI